MIRIIGTKLVIPVIVLLLLPLFFTSQVQAQVVINEVSPASDPEWVELYNTGTSPVSLKNYSINFGSDTQNKYFCDTENINANTYRIISLSTHWLADTSDTVTLKNGDDAVDSIAYGTGHALKSPTADGSISRSPDGGSTWVVLTSPTQQGDQISFDCPTPDPTITPTPSPTPLITPSKAVYKINKPKDNSSNELSSVQIYVDGGYIHHEDDETLEFFVGNECYLGIGCGFGIHTISLRKDGYSNWEDNRDFSAGMNLEVIPILVKQATTSPTTSPSPIPSKSPTSTPTKTPYASPSDPPEEVVLGAETIIPTSLPAQSPKLIVDPSRKIESTFPIWAIGLTFVGLGLIGFSIFSIIRNTKKGYTIGSEKEDSQIS